MVPPKDGFMDLDNHPSTTDEIRALCSDLGVLGRADFKMLLKWRLAVRKSRGLDGKRKAALRGGVVKHASDDDDDSGADSGADEDAEGGAEDEDEKLLGEMAKAGVSTRAAATRRKRRKSRRRSMRVALGRQGQDEEGAMGASEMDLFSSPHQVQGWSRRRAERRRAGTGRRARFRRRRRRDGGRVRLGRFGRRRGRPRRRAIGGGTRPDVARVQGATHQEGRAIHRAE